jgi:hypothetical protein
MEGINNRAPVIAKRCYGLKSSDTVWKRLILDLNRASEAVGQSIDELGEIVSRLQPYCSGSAPKTVRAWQPRPPEPGACAVRGTVVYKGGIRVGWRSGQPVCRGDRKHAPGRLPLRGCQRCLSWRWKRCLEHRPVDDPGRPADIILEARAWRSTTRAR